MFLEAQMLGRLHAARLQPSEPWLRRGEGGRLSEASTRLGVKRPGGFFKTNTRDHEGQSRGGWPRAIRALGPRGHKGPGAGGAGQVAIGPKGYRQC